ncbi:MAG: hypothetical protein ACKVP7_24510 [Hyphomicrobiaceae bacterium]
MINSLLSHATGSFVVADSAVGVSRQVRVHYARPSSEIRRAAITVALHGVDRAAAAFRDVMAARAERNGQLIFVPEFDLQQFPDVHAYNFGGVRAPPPDNSVRAREQWTFGIVDRLFTYLRTSIGTEQTAFSLFGLSAGAQFVLRYMALSEAPLVERAIAANSGIYMLPDMGLDYPTGIGGIGLGEAALRRYLARPLTILIGENDADPDAFDLPRGEIAQAQGPHRLARAQWHMAHCGDLARSLGVELGWRYEIVPGAGHVSQAMFDRALDLLADSGGLQTESRPP